MMITRAAIMVLLLATLTTQAMPQDRAITRSGQRISSADELPDQQEADFSDVVVEAELEQLVAKLADDDYAAREQATTQLLHHRFDRAQIYKLLAGATLSPEQRHRLLAVVVEQLRTTPRGAVGINLHWEDGPVAEPGSIIVDGVVPGMPAEKALQFGDRIILINGQPMMFQNDFVREVQGRQPGETVRFTIERAKRDAQGEEVFDERGKQVFDTLNVTIELGSVEQLSEVNRGRPIAGPIVDQIQGEISWAVRRFSPPKRSIPLPVDINNRSSINDIQASVYDRHPAIESLLFQLARLEAGMIKNDAALLAEWRLQLARLRDEINTPGLSEDQRNYLRGVAERYQELLQR